jgi:hypothetical protein
MAALLALEAATFIFMTAFLLALETFLEAPPRLTNLFPLCLAVLGILYSILTKKTKKMAKFNYLIHLKTK